MATQVSQAAQTLAAQTVTTQPGNGSVAPPAAITLAPTINPRDYVSATGPASATVPSTVPTTAPRSPTTAPAEPPKTAAAIVQTEAEAEAESESTRKHILSDAWLRELEAKAQAQWRAIVGVV